MELILGQYCFHAIRSLEIYGDKSRKSPFAARLPIAWVLSGPVPSSLSLPSHNFKCSVEGNSLVEQIKSWYEFESYDTYKLAAPRSASDKQALKTLESTISHEDYAIGMHWVSDSKKILT